MTKDKIVELHGLASNGIIRPQLAANLLTDVCETALALFKTVEQQNLRLKKLEATESLDNDKQQKTP